MAIIYICNRPCHYNEDQPTKSLTMSSAAFSTPKYVETAVNVPGIGG